MICKTIQLTGISMFISFYCLMSTACVFCQRERNALLSEAHAKGHAVYSGIRYSTTGKKIKMTDGILFTLFDERGIYAGQAVLVENLEYIE